LGTRKGSEDERLSNKSMDGDIIPSAGSARQDQDGSGREVLEENGELNTYAASKKSCRTWMNFIKR